MGSYTDHRRSWVWEAFREKGRSITLEAKGESMLPAIAPGSRVEVRRLTVDDPLENGDIALVETRRGAMIHRVVAQRSGCVYTRGDNLPLLDPAVSREQVIGVVVHINGRNVQGGEAAGHGRINADYRPLHGVDFIFAEGSDGSSRSSLGYLLTLGATVTELSIESLRILVDDQQNGGGRMLCVTESAPDPLVSLEAGILTAKTLAVVVADACELGLRPQHGIVYGRVGEPGEAVATASAASWVGGVLASVRGVVR